jgi:hypothetical protein
MGQDYHSHRIEPYSRNAILIIYVWLFKKTEIKTISYVQADQTKLFKIVDLKYYVPYKVHVHFKW